MWDVQFVELHCAHLSVRMVTGISLNAGNILVYCIFISSVHIFIDARSFQGFDTMEYYHWLLHTKSSLNKALDQNKKTRKLLSRDISFLINIPLCPNWINLKILPPPPPQKKIYDVYQCASSCKVSYWYKRLGGWLSYLLLYNSTESSASQTPGI